MSQLAQYVFAMCCYMLADSSILSSVPSAQHSNSCWLFSIWWQDFVVELVPAGEAHPAMHFAGGRTVVSVELLAQPMKMVLSESFCLIEQRIDDLASGGGIIELLDVLGNDFKV